MSCLFYRFGLIDSLACQIFYVNTQTGQQSRDLPTEAEGDEDAIRASREGEFSPSTNLWARMKHAAAMIRMSNSRQRTVRYLD